MRDDSSMVSLFDSPPATEEIALELKDIKAIVDLMKKNGLSVFELEKEGVRLKLERGPGEFVTQTPREPEPAQSGATSKSDAAADLPAPRADGKEILSPMVGTFYASSAPDAPPFVSVGKEIAEDTVVCIIEAMKVMNEIKAEIRGTVTEVLVEDGSPVHFGQPLFRVK